MFLESTDFAEKLYDTRYSSSMNRFSMQVRSNRFAFIVGAIIGVIAIKTQPDGNLLVTTACALIAGTIALTIWNLLKKLSTKLGKRAQN